MIEIHENYSLKNHNTFGLEVVAERFLTFDSMDDLGEVFNYEDFDKCNFLIIGGGSNLLMRPYFRGLVLSPQLQKIEKIGENSQEVLLRVESGMVWDDLVAYTVDNEWSGLENLSGIPGHVGAAPVQNIGAYGVEVQNVIYQVEVFDLFTGKVRYFQAADCQFAYRYSRFKRYDHQNFMVIAVFFRLAKQARLKTTYARVEEMLAPYSEKTIKNLRKAIMDLRNRKLPDYEQLGNAGSFFKNPIVNSLIYSQLNSLYPTIPCYELSDGQYKIPAAWLIDQAGWKGYRLGDAGVYDRQALILVNYGKAQAQDLIALSERIQQSVYEKFGINLEPEVKII